MGLGGGAIHGDSGGSGLQGGGVLAQRLVAGARVQQQCCQQAPAVMQGHGLAVAALRLLVLQRTKVAVACEAQTVAELVAAVASAAAAALPLGWWINENDTCIR